MEYTQAEASILKTMISSEEKRLKILNLMDDTDNYFTVPENRTIANKIIELHKEGAFVETELIISETGIPSNNIKNIVDSYSELSEVNLSRVLSHLRDSKINTDLKSKFLIGLTKIADDPSMSVSKKIDSLLEEIQVIKRRNSSISDGFKDMSTLMKEHKRVLDGRLLTPEHYPCGDSRLDAALTYGLAPENSTLIAGRPSTGKSAYSLELERLISSKGTPVAKFNLEMGNKGNLDRLISMETQIHPDRLIRAFGSLTGMEVNCLNKKLEDMPKTHNMFMMDKAGMSLAKCEQELCKLQEKLKTQYLVGVWDLFTHLSDFRGVTSAYGYEDVCKKFQEMYKRLGIHGIMVLQINRKADEDKVTKIKDIPKTYPKTSHIKNSDSFLEIADNVLLVSRPIMHVRGTDLEEGFPEYLRVELAKQRATPPQGADTVFLYKIMKEYMGFITPPPSWNPLEYFIDEDD